MERLIPTDPLRTHDLLRLKGPSSLATEMSLPPWVEPALRRAPWVVVRRGEIRNGLVPVGIRGRVRRERFAAWLPLDEVLEVRSPEDLVDAGPHIAPRRLIEAPALAALVRIHFLLERRGFHWGPGGSVGYEIASGVTTANFLSDLDLIVRLEHPIAPCDAADLLAILTETAAPAGIDVLLETPEGGIALAEWAASPSMILLRTPFGPRLSVDPWMAGASCLTGSVP